MTSDLTFGLTMAITQFRHRSAPVENVLYCWHEQVVEKNIQVSVYDVDKGQPVCHVQSFCIARHIPLY